MEKEHQEYLFKLCEEVGLDHVQILAVLKHESQFDSKAISPGGDYGYMQINRVNHKYLAVTLGAPNDPLDPYTNLNGGLSVSRCLQLLGVTGHIRVTVGRTRFKYLQQRIDRVS